MQLFTLPTDLKLPVTSRESTEETKVLCDCTHRPSPYKLDVRKCHSTMKMAVFWYGAPCNLAEVYRRFRSACCLQHQAASTSEKSVNYYQNTRRNVPEDSHLHTRRRENLEFNSKILSHFL
jgi:hypothetical protein